MDKLILTQNIIDEINGLGKAYNGFERQTLKDVNKINLNKFPQIRAGLKLLKPNTFDFKKIFTDDNDITFAPKKLVFTDLFTDYLKQNEDEIMFFVKTTPGKTFLVYIGHGYAPNYIWEITTEEVEPEETEASAEGEEEGFGEEEGAEEEAF